MTDVLSSVCCDSGCLLQSCWPLDCPAAGLCAQLTRQLCLQHRQAGAMTNARIYFCTAAATYSASGHSICKAGSTAEANCTCGVGRVAFCTAATGQVAVAARRVLSVSENKSRKGCTCRVGGAATCAAAAGQAAVDARRVHGRPRVRALHAQLGILLHAVCAQQRILHTASGLHPRRCAINA